jgi:hypothetical protein
MDDLFIHFGVFEAFNDFDSSIDERGESNDVSDGEGDGDLLSL